LRLDGLAASRVLPNSIKPVINKALCEPPRSLRGSDGLSFSLTRFLRSNSKFLVSSLQLFKPVLLLFSEIPVLRNDINGVFSSGGVGRENVFWLDPLRQHILLVDVPEWAAFIVVKHELLEVGTVAFAEQHAVFPVDTLEVLFVTDLFVSASSLRLVDLNIGKVSSCSDKAIFVHLFGLDIGCEVPSPILGILVEGSNRVVSISPVNCFEFAREAECLIGGHQVDNLSFHGLHDDLSTIPKEGQLNFAWEAHIH